MTGLWLAVGFLTSIPVRVQAPPQGGLGRAAVWFPVAGLLLGGLLAAAQAALGLVFPPLLTAGLVVMLWATLTGGLHLDGLADCCDGLLAAVSRERRLEILRDSHVGAFGAIGLALFLILKVLTVASLPAGQASAYFPFGATTYALLLAPTLARALLLPVALLPAARAEGLGAGFAQGLVPHKVAVAALLPLALIFLGGWQAVAAAAAACIVTLGSAGLARARLGGVTGDVLGLAVELAELAVLLAFAGRLPS